MPDYSKGKIYTIRCRTDDTMIYVGSTTQPLCERLAQHKRDSKRENKKNRLIYKTINDNWDEWYIEFYELCPCNSKEELCKKEGEITREIGTLNMIISGRTYNEYRNDNKEKVKKYEKKYRDNNKEKRAEYAKEYREANKEKKAQYNKAYREEKMINKNIPYILESN